MADRNIAMEIATAFAKADAQTLASIGYELLAALSKAEGEVLRLDARRSNERERQRRKRGSRGVTGGHGTNRDSLNGSPHPSLNPTSPSSSSPREAAAVPDAEARLARRFLTDHGRNALVSVLARCERKVDVVAEIGMILDGGRPNVSHMIEHMELALSDYAANGMSDGRFNAVHFRKHVQRAAQPEVARRKNGTNAGAQMVQNIMGEHAND